MTVYWLIDQEVSVGVRGAQEVGGGDEVSRSLLGAQARHRDSDEGLGGQPQLGPRRPALRGGRGSEGVHVDRGPDDRVLVRAAYPPGQALAPERVRSGHQGRVVADPQARGADVEGALQGVAGRVPFPAVNVGHLHRHRRPQRRPRGQHLRLRPMGMDDMRTDLAEQVAQLPDRPPVFRGMRRTNQVRHEPNRQALLAHLVQQTALGAAVRPHRQGHLVPRRVQRPRQQHRQQRAAAQGSVLDRSKASERPIPGS